MSASQFRSLVNTYLDLDGEAVIALVPDESGDLEHCPLPQSWCHQEGARIEATISGSKFIFTQGVDAYVLKVIDPANPYGRGRGLWRSLEDEVSTAEYAARHASAFFHNSAKPELLIHYDGDPSRREEIEEKWNARHRGFRKAWRAAFVAGKTVTVHQLGTNFKDLGMVEYRKFIADAIRYHFAIPPEIIGQVENSNRATIKAAWFLFMKGCVDPRCKRIARGYESQAFECFDDTDGLYVEYDSPVPADDEFKLKVMEAMPESYTINDWRRLSGDAPLVGGDVILRQADHWEEVKAEQVIDVSPASKQLKPMARVRVLPPPIPAELKGRVLRLRAPDSKQGAA